jgi:glyceraldehyde-3-phosphate dehydrogenase (NADP+)
MARMIDACVNQVGRINLNAQCQRGPDSYPFNGRKDSAEGTLSVADALRVFSIRTLVAARDNAASKALIGSIIHDRESSFLSTDYIFGSAGSANKKAMSQLVVVAAAQLLPANNTRG